MKLADMIQAPRADERGQHHVQHPLGAEGDAEAHPAWVRPITPPSASPATGRAEAGRTATPASATTRRPGGGGPALPAPPGCRQPLPRSRSPGLAPSSLKTPVGSARRPKAFPSSPRAAPQLQGRTGSRWPGSGSPPLTSPPSCSMAPATPIARLTRGERGPPLSGASDWREPGKTANQRRVCSRRAPRGARREV